MSIEPYYADDMVQLYQGRFEDVLPALDLPKVDLVCTDPPYGETSLDWDRWPDSWPLLMQDLASSMWCFGSMRMFLDRRAEFDGWKLSQDVVWEKHAGSSFVADRFKRVHEHALHWYRGAWADIHHEPQRAPGGDGTKNVPKRQSAKARHTGVIGDSTYTDDGTRMLRSVIKARSMHYHAINETEKPTGLLEPLISYACPPGGLILDPFAGSCSSAVAARNIGRRAICIEQRESQCEKAALRLAHAPLNFGEPA